MRPEEVVTDVIILQPLAEEPGRFPRVSGTPYLIPDPNQGRYQSRLPVRQVRIIAAGGPHRVT